MRPTLLALPSLIIIIALIFGTNSIANAQQGNIIPIACATATYTLDPGTTIHFYDDGGPGGNCLSDGFPGNYANANCETITTICPAPGETLSIDMVVLSMYGTGTGWDWMVVYEGSGTTGNIIFDNRAGGIDNPNGTDCDYINMGELCAVNDCFTFRFYATSVVNKEGWDAIVTSAPTSSGAIDLDITAPTCAADGFAEITNYDNTLTYTFLPAGPSIGASGLITGATFGQNYSVKIGAGGCDATATFQIQKKLITPTVNAGNDIEICAGSSVTLTASNPNNANISWDNGINNGQAFTPTSTGSTTYTVTAELNTCTSTDEVVVKVNPSKPYFYADNPIGCSPHTVTFIDTSGFDGLSCFWMFGDGGTSNTCGTVSHTYTESGVYDVILNVENEFGCLGNITLTNYIEIGDGVIANFTADPMITDITNTEVNFTNESIDATSYIWNFGDLSPPVNDVDPIHNFPNNTAGTYTVTLEAFNSSGCTDKASLVIIIENPDLIYTIPNVFTPNGDNENDFFKLINPENIPGLEVVVLNRWGNVVFESGEVNFAWNGLINNTGAECSDGTYFYKVTFKDYSGEEIIEHGFVQLARDN